MEVVVDKNLTLCPMWRWRRGLTAGLAGGAERETTGGAELEVGQPGQTGDTDQGGGQPGTPHHGRLGQHHLPALQSPPGPHTPPSSLPSHTDNLQDLHRVERSRILP